MDVSCITLGLFPHNMYSVHIYFSLRFVFKMKLGLTQPRSSCLISTLLSLLRLLQESHLSMLQVNSFGWTRDSNRFDQEEWRWREANTEKRDRSVKALHGLNKAGRVTLIRWGCFVTEKLDPATWQFPREIWVWKIVSHFCMQFPLFSISYSLRMQQFTSDKSS